MKKIEKDLLLLGLIGDALKKEGIKLKDIIQDYDGQKTLELLQNNVSTNVNDGLILIAKECYRNIHKKSKK